MNKFEQSYPSVSVLKFRHFAKKAIRSLFDDQGFIEIDTPYILTANTPDPHIDPILVTAQNIKRAPLQLHTSPEIWLKQALGLGLPKIYHMARVFRDDPPGRHHNIEFTMLEWYRTNADLSSLIADCEAIFHTTLLSAQSQNLSTPTPKPFISITLTELFKEQAGLDLDAILRRIAQGSRNHLQKTLEERGEHLPHSASFFDAFFHIMLKYIEPTLPADHPVVITRWPIQLAALSASCQDDPNFCDRFEIYFRGLEIANAYQECTSPNELRSRFIRENSDRKAIGKAPFPIDENFLSSIARMPKTAGIALGLDRLFLAISGQNHISEMIFGYNDH